MIFVGMEGAVKTRSKYFQKKKKFKIFSCTGFETMRVYDCGSKILNKLRKGNTPWTTKLI